jgi:hypothetical protein
MTRTLAEEYEICQDRGHVPGTKVLLGAHTHYVCSKCQTRYWTENVLHETNVPAGVTRSDGTTQPDAAASILAGFDAIEERLRQERAFRSGGGF